MPQLTIAFKLLISLIIGAVIGLEREAIDKPMRSKKEDSAPHSLGVRTFSLITTLGTLGGLLWKDFQPFSLIITLTFMTLLVLYYVLNTLTTKDVGFTTELAILYSYLIGFFIARDIFPMPIILAITVLLTLILARKEDIKHVITHIQREEINAFISFALIGLVILPFIPNKGYTFSDIPGLTEFFKNYGLSLGKLSKIELINPFKLWSIVALITGIDVIGYALERVIGQRGGRLISSIIGGFISSTATTQSIAQESKTSRNPNALVGAAIFANLASFFPIFILIASVNTRFLTTVTPTLVALIISAFITGLFFILRKTKEAKRKATQKQDNEIHESDIFALIPALKFATIFLVVRLVTQVALIFFGQAGFLISSALAALTGIDAATINISQLAGKEIEMKLAVLSFILVNGVNLLAKTFYSYLQGKKEFALKFGLSMAIIILASLIGILFA